MNTENKFDLVDKATACAILGGEDHPIHPSTFWRGIKARRYPEGIKVGPGIIRWRRSELLAVLERAAAQRDGVAA